MERLGRFKSGALLIGALVLVFGVILQVFRVRDLSAGDVLSKRNSDYFIGKVPTELPGWQARDAPLGTSELLRGQVEATLNYDAYVYRIFTRGDTQVGAYLAYWRKDRMPVSRVASHTPDRCWTENGWTCESMKFNEIWSVPAGGVFQPGQRRVFKSPGGIQENVIFWHLINGKAFDFGERFTLFTHPGKWLRDTIAYAVLGSGEQCFIRLTSNRPFEELKGDPGWEELLAALAKLGLEAPQAPKPEG